jgi:hypothetical protein
LASFIAKAICLCATPNDGHPNAIAPATNTKDGWVVGLAGRTSRRRGGLGGRRGCALAVNGKAKAASVAASIHRLSCI